MKIPYPSKSSDATHYVTIHPSGGITCTCRGFRTPNGCWHVKDAAEKHTGPLPAVVAPKKVLEEPDPELELNTAFVTPQLASALKEGRDLEDYAQDGWVLEEKVDGHRMILHVTPNGVIAWSRGEKVRRLPDHITTQARFLAPGTYDGELYVPGGTSTDVTALHLQSGLKLVLFDILRVGTESCMSLTTRERRSLLEVAVREVEDSCVHVIQQFPVTREGLDSIWSRGGEGAIIKRMLAPYLPGKRVPDWVKFKKEGAAEVTVTGFIPGRLGPHSVITAVDDHGIAVQVKALNDEWRAAFATAAQSYIGRRLTIAYQEKTRDGRYRHPRADHWA